MYEKKLHAFEPNRSTFQALKQDILFNNSSHVNAKPLVLCSHDGTISFDANPTHRGTTSISTESNYLVDLPCITLDTYTKQEKISDIAFLMAEVEGYEEQVFHGAKDLLKQKRIQVIYYEVCPNNATKSNLNPEKTTHFLQANGYAVYKLDSKGNLQPITEFNYQHIVLDNWIRLSTAAQHKLLIDS